MNITQKATGYLVLLTFFWGLTFPLVGASVKHVDPYGFVFYRFVLAACFMLPFIVRKLKKLKVNVFLYCVLLGFLNNAIYSLQSAGLKTISPNESAFITSSSVIMVPFLSLLLRVNIPKSMDYICALICLAGLYILTGANMTHISIGQIETGLCALAVALYIIVLQHVSTFSKDYDLIAFYQIVMTAIFALPFGWQSTIVSYTNVSVILAILFCAIFATNIAIYLQSRYQHYVTPAKAALIFCLEPVFASICNWMLNGENISGATMLGGSLILLGVALPDILKLVPERVPR